jgi:hypothetical protein
MALLSSVLLSNKAKRVNPSMGSTQASGQCAQETCVLHSLISHIHVTSALSNMVYPYTVMLVKLAVTTSEMLPFNYIVAMQTAVLWNRAQLI